MKLPTCVHIHLDAFWKLVNPSFHGLEALLVRHGIIGPCHEHEAMLKGSNITTFLKTAEETPRTPTGATLTWEALPPRLTVLVIMSERDTRGRMLEIYVLPSFIYIGLVGRRPARAMVFAEVGPLCGSYPPEKKLLRLRAKRKQRCSLCLSLALRSLDVQTRYQASESRSGRFNQVVHVALSSILDNGLAIDDRAEVYVQTR